MTETVAGPDGTAERVALWRAMHVRIDPPPHVLEDEIGLRLAGPPDGWRDRGDMHADGTRTFRASIVARSRFVEDLVLAQADQGVTQYVLLGAGLDTFVQRHPEAAARLQVFEIDRPGPQAWKRGRLAELGYGVPDGLHLVADDFETDGSWWGKLARSGFDRARPAVVASLGVSMYLTREANLATLRQLASLPAGWTLVMTFRRRWSCWRWPNARGANTPSGPRVPRVPRSSASSPPPRSSTWPGRPGSGRCGTSRPPN